MGKGAASKEGTPPACKLLASLEIPKKQDRTGEGLGLSETPPFPLKGGERKKPAVCQRAPRRKEAFQREEERKAGCI